MKDGAVLLIPAELDEEMLNRVRKTAVKAYLAAGIDGMAQSGFLHRQKKPANCF